MKYRQLLRFRLRTLLIAFTIVSIWLAFHVTSTRRQKTAVNGIREYGGWVRYDFQYPSGQFSPYDFDSQAESWVPQWALNRFGIDFFHGITFVSLNYSDDSGEREENENLSDDALQHLPKLPDLRVLLLCDTQATDSSMVHLAALSNLEYLYMWDVSQVSDKGVLSLAELKELRKIHISNSLITDESMRVFATLPKIETLNLQGNRFSNDALMHISAASSLRAFAIGGGENTIDDDGLVHLKNLAKLERIGLQGSRVTGSGFVHLEKLDNLKELGIGKSQLVESELMSLREKLPNLKVW